MVPCCRGGWPPSTEDDQNCVVVQLSNVVPIILSDCMATPLVTPHAKIIVFMEQDAMDTNL